jgi:membrane-bound ClpP family serine protease
MFKIIIGIIMVVGGLSGKLVLVGTQSGVALAVLGAALIVWELSASFAKSKAAAIPNPKAFEVKQ